LSVDWNLRSPGRRRERERRREQRDEVVVDEEEMVGESVEKRHRVEEGEAGKVWMTLTIVWLEAKAKRETHQIRRIRKTVLPSSLRSLRSAVPPPPSKKAKKDSPS